MTYLPLCIRAEQHFFVLPVRFASGEVRSPVGVRRGLSDVCGDYDRQVSPEIMLVLHF